MKIKTSEKKNNKVHEKIFGKNCGTNLTKMNLYKINDKHTKKNCVTA